ncbi:MAG: metallophosphoesterase family protein [Pyrinomonadaceae bacterium]
MRRTCQSILTVLVLVLVSFLSPTYCQTISNISARGSKVSLPAKPTLPLSLPLNQGSVRFAVIGDTGSGTDKQQQVANMMLKYRAAFPFEFVLMMGDNLYGSETPKDYQLKFENVYRPLINEKIKFYATLGNHDQPNERFYEYFNMNGKEYYRFSKGNVAFYGLNSNYMDKAQLKWLESELAKDTSEWKVAFFHHPPYSSAKKHGSDTSIRKVLEPLFLKYGVNLVLNGHDHVYERIKPQKGIYYFVSGAGGQLRNGDIKSGSPLTAKSYDRDMHFMLFEVVKDQMYFQVISRTGETVDSGVLSNQKKKA